ncbi:glutathione S-transferase [Marinomonas sp. A79]|uniref:Glutathione S-transferase n=1 Tax=Marinomonas vulgaris TaxID=2823372 RepID=A0ABS5HED6_9GAMM|nr:glutathione S-transferase [Marinomonas vulgaris]MBR7890023.1 glutathione S-transferase [Marinomonas vulgaris]
MLPILYSFRRCPYAIRARYSLALLEVPVRLREVVLKSKPEALLALGGRSSVPQLIDPEGRRYPESMDIIFWALSVSQKSDVTLSLWPDEPRTRKKMLTWINYNDRFFKHWLDRYKYADRHPEHSEQYYRTKGEVLLARLENRLAKQHYLFGEEISIADVAIFPFIRQFAAVDQAWFDHSQYSKVRAWLTGFLQTECFTDVVMVKLPPWQAGQEEVLFPAS